MAFKRIKAGPNLTESKKRLGAVKSINKKKGRSIDYGDEENPLDAETVEAEVTAQEKRINDYNALLDQIDSLGNAIEAGEKRLGTINNRLLSGARSKFGVDADEVEQLGGTRQSERKKAVRKEAAPATTTTTKPTV